MGRASLGIWKQTSVKNLPFALLDVVCLTKRKSKARFELTSFVPLRTHEANRERQSTSSCT